MSESTSESTPEPTPDEMAESTPSDASIAPASDTVASEQQGPSYPPPGLGGPPHGEPASRDLPPLARGLLSIRVPLRVTLAAQRKPIQEILELGPGSIVKFDKTCDEPLELAVGNQTIALGEVVKVGDKFGLRIGALRAPRAK